MRSRRRTKYTWFPILGSNFPASETGAGRHVTVFFNELTVPRTDNTPVSDGAGLFVQPILPDFTAQEDGNTVFTLNDYVQGQEYILKRIVGSIFLGVSTPGDSTDSWGSILVTAGFFVARADESDSTQVALDSESTDPLSVINAQNPWIWRRSWMLGNDPARVLQTPGSNPVWPQTNSAYGSMREGTHIDSKVARRVRREARLWFALSAIGVDANGISQPGTDDTNINMALDIRILGAMRRAKNASAF